MNAFTETSAPNFAEYLRGSGVPARSYLEKIKPKNSARPENFSRTTSFEKFSLTDRSYLRILHRRSLTEQAVLWREVFTKQDLTWQPAGFTATQKTDWKNFCGRAWAEMTVREKKFWIAQMPGRAAEKKPETLLAAPLRTADADLLRYGDTTGMGFEIMAAADALGKTKSPPSRLPISVRAAAAQAFTGEQAGVSGVRHVERRVAGDGSVSEAQLGRRVATCEAGLRSAVRDERLRLFSALYADPKLFSHADSLLLGQQLFLTESTEPVVAPHANDLVEEARAGHPGWYAVKQSERLYVWDVSGQGKKSLRGFYEGEIFYPHADQSFKVTTNTGAEILIDETQLNILRSVDGAVVIIPAGEAGMKTLHSPRPFGTTKPLDKNQAVWGSHGATHITLQSGRHFVNAAGDVFGYDKIIGLHHVGVLAS